MKKVKICAVILVLLAVIVFPMAGCGKKAQGPSPSPVTPQATSPAPPPASPGKAATSATETPGGPPPSPTQENSFSLVCDLSFEDGTQPVAFTGGGGAELSEFPKTKVLITLKDKTRDYSAVVKKETDKWIFGTLIWAPSGKMADYKKVDKIVIRTEGYKDLVFKNLPIVSGRVDLGTVVIKK